MGGWVSLGDRSRSLGEGWATRSRGEGAGGGGLSLGDGSIFSPGEICTRELGETSRLSDALALELLLLGPFATCSLLGSGACEARFSELSAISRERTASR